jgi:hypothetical protein
MHNNSAQINSNKIYLMLQKNFSAVGKMAQSSGSLYTCSGCIYSISSAFSEATTRPSSVISEAVEYKSGSLLTIMVLISTPGGGEF